MLVPLAVACALLPPCTQTCSIRPAALRCEAQVDPLAVRQEPQLSFRLEATDPEARGQALVAWQVQVAPDEQAFASGEGLHWDSGRVMESDTTAIDYAGEALSAAQRCLWRACVWDEADRPSEWSAPASFTIGIEEWQAEWIGWDAPLQSVPRAPSLDGAEWIGHPEDKLAQTPAEDRYYRRRFELPESPLRSAMLVATADNRLELFLNGEPLELQPGEASQWKLVKVLDVARDLRPGVNLLASRVRNSEPGETGLIAKLSIELETGESLEIVSDAKWHVSRERERGWTLPDYPEKDGWVEARSNGAYPTAPWGRLRTEALFLPAPRRLRGEFTIERPVRRALLYSTALGIHDLYLDGQRVNDAWFEPGWTDYTKRVHYRAWDVTERLTEGPHALAAELADGWFAGYVGFGYRREHYGAKTRLRSQLSIDYEDGTREVWGTSADWRAAEGPVREADFLMGERWDARLETEGWAQPDFEDEAWQTPDLGLEPTHLPLLEAHPGPPVLTVAEFTPVSQREIEPGTWIFDLGQNIAGVARLRVRAEAGDEIRLRHAERLDEDGQLYTTNLRGARAIDVYHCRGGAEEVFEPRFTFHGFQYVEVSGLRAAPRAGDLVGLALSSDTPDVGSFECSDERITRLVQNAYWTQRANFIDVPTDCPQRDERLGWTGDAQVYLRSATFLNDVQGFFRKWLVDLEDSQRADGQFPMVAPLKVAGGDGGPAWADAGVFCPWDVWQIYGNRRDLEARYESMKRFVEFCRERSTPELLPPEKFHCFGDWLHVDDETPKSVIYSAYFAASTDLLARAAKVLGRAEDARQYTELATQLRQVFERTYIDPEGRVTGNSQTGYVLVLAFDLVSGELRERAAEHLIAKIEERDWHLSTGFVGTKDLMSVLAKIGRNDVAYRLLENDTHPSWLFALKHGATSIWERWNGWTPEEGFADPGMNSFAHYAFGAVVQWIFENVGGIRAASPGYAEVDLRPQPGGSLTWARTRYQSIRGPIETEWRLENERLILTVSLPPGSSAVLHMPTSQPDSIREGGRPLDDAPGLTLVSSDEGESRVRLEAGTYHFECSEPRLQRLELPE